METVGGSTRPPAITANAAGTRAFSGGGFAVEDAWVLVRVDVDPPDGDVLVRVDVDPLDGDVLVEWPVPAPEPAVLVEVAVLEEVATDVVFGAVEEECDELPHPPTARSPLANRPKRRAKRLTFPA